MKKLIGILLLLAMLTSLTAPAFADEPDYTTGTPWLCIDLEGNVTEETETNLKDDYALAVSKDKMLVTAIPEGYPCGGTAVDVQLKLSDDIKSMFLGDAPEGHDAKLAYDLFWLMMDWDSRNAKGVAPLKEQVDAVEALDTVDALNTYFIEVPAADQLFALWGSGSGVDFIDSSRYSLYVEECGLLLDDSAEYSALTDYGRIKKEAWSELAEKMLVKLGYTNDEARQKIENCFAYETMLAAVIPSSEEQQRPDYISSILNYYTPDELREAQGKLPVLEVLAAYGYPEADAYVVTNPGFLDKLNELYTEENLTLMKDYMIVHGVIGSAGSLDRECYEWRYDAVNAISGANGMLDDETVFSSSVSGTLEWPVAQLYTQTYLKQEDKDRISMLIDRLLDAYHGVINEAVFLSDATKANAIRKLEAIDKRVLFPDSWEKYECGSLSFASPKEGGTLWQAIRSITAYEVAKNVREYAKPVDKAKWDETPHTVNCLYDPQANAMYIMGAFSQGAMYRSDMSDEELLAKLGWVIGHEISHAFDSSGAQFDKDGNMADWWTEKDYAAFLARNEKMVAYYNNMHPWAGQDFHGSIMTGEAGADMAGMKVVLRIASKIKGFDYDKLFRSFTDVWLVKQTIQSSYAQINDPHPMGYLRINCTLQQFDDFLNFYGIKKGDGMYLAPEDRVAIW